MVGLHQWLKLSIGGRDSMKVAPYLAGSSTSPKEASLHPSALALQETLLLGSLVQCC